MTALIHKYFMLSETVENTDVRVFFDRREGEKANALVVIGDHATPCLLKLAPVYELLAAPDYTNPPECAGYSVDVIGNSYDGPSISLLKV